MPLPERELIRHIRRNTGNERSPIKLDRARSGEVRIGIGDDCAVLRLARGHEALVTTDFSLEGVHFLRDAHPAEFVGHRCLTRGLSDIAAMGGEPIAAFLSLALPADLEQRWVDGFFLGFRALARRFGLELAGGDIAQSPAGVLADVVIVGSVPQGKAILRSGAKPGDDIYVTGLIGGAAAELRALLAEREKPKKPKPSSTLRFRKPLPRIEAGRFLREQKLASAMIDLSDGLSTDLWHICEESGVGAWISEKAIPVTSNATLEDALNGGDDYELLFTVPAHKSESLPEKIAGVGYTYLGTITSAVRGKRAPVGQPQMWLVAPDMKSRRELKPRGWQHFE
jgi:thiamine-monophosphate kinase